MIPAASTMAGKGAPTPVSPFPAFKLGEKVDDPLAMYLADIYTITGSLAGVPCMSVPCGTTAEGLPVSRGSLIVASVMGWRTVSTIPH